MGGIGLDGVGEDCVWVRVDLSGLGGSGMDGIGLDGIGVE